MEDIIPVSNPGKNPIYIAGVMIPPGETRLMPAQQAVNHLPVAAPIPTPAATPETPPPDITALEELLTHSVDHLEDNLASQTIDDLALLLELEAAGKNRVTALEAIQDEQQRRAT